jgi:hypothetical protein
MVFCSEQNSVVEAAVSLMTKLHLNISIELKEQYRRIRMDLIEKVIEQVRVELQRKADDPRRFKRVILRSQLVLRELMNESELLGVGSLRSLAGLVKGELLHLSINNEITFGLVRK